VRLSKHKEGKGQDGTEEGEGHTQNAGRSIKNDVNALEVGFRRSKAFLSFAAERVVYQLDGARSLETQRRSANLDPIQFVVLIGNNESQVVIMPVTKQRTLRVRTVTEKLGDNTTTIGVQDQDVNVNELICGPLYSVQRPSVQPKLTTGTFCVPILTGATSLWANEGKAHALRSNRHIVRN